MTNTPSGSKRPWEGNSGYSRDSKRSRDDSRDTQYDHYSSSGRRDYGHRSDRRHGDSGRPRDSEDGRNGRNRGQRREPSRSRSHGRRIDSIREGRLVEDTLVGPSADDEKEEGEISPRPPVNDKIAVNDTVDIDFEGSDSPPSLEDTLAARRARREAILAKYAHTGSNSPAPVPDSGSTSVVFGTSIKRTSLSPPPTPGQDFTLAKDNNEEISKQMPTQNAVEQLSAADYDPSLDQREDEHKRIHPAEVAINVDDEQVEESDEDEDEDDLDDMFAVATTEKKTKKVKKVAQPLKPLAPAFIATTLDSAADAEGYYSVILGEHLDGGRYQVFSSLGKGMFANVVRARVLVGDHDESVNKEVAIKIIRSQESMYKAGLKEVAILNKLKQADPDDKKHIVRLERTFEHRGHLCMVFESLSMNLRDVVKRFGKDVGLNIRAVRAYAHQLFLSLSLLKKLDIMHADIKPDNILVNEQKTQLKLCDLGSASDASENGITPYLVSRFYRAPEIILGVPYDPSLDIWSIGCTLFELYTGKILFPGRSNNQMLLLMMELKGRFNGKMIKKAKFGDVYFDEMGGFLSLETDRVLGTDVVRKIHISAPTRDLKARLMPSASVKMKDDENKMLVAFIDLLDKCLALDPGRRITPKEALMHAFIRG